MPASEQPITLRDLEAAYAAGNFAELRRSSRRVLAQSGADAELIASAKQMLDRVAPDPVALWTIACCGLLFCVIVLRYVI